MVGAPCARPPSPWCVRQVRPSPTCPHARVRVPPCPVDPVPPAVLAGWCIAPAGALGRARARQTRDGGRFRTGPDRELQTVRQAMIDFLQNHTDSSRPPACPALEPLRCAEEFNLVKRSCALRGAGPAALGPALLASTKSLSLLLKGPATFFLSLTTLTAVTWRFYLRATARMSDERYRVCVFPVLPRLGLRVLGREHGCCREDSWGERGLQGQSGDRPTRPASPSVGWGLGTPGSRGPPSTHRFTTLLCRILNAQPFCQTRVLSTVSPLCTLALLPSHESGSEPLPLAQPQEDAGTQCRRGTGTPRARREPPPSALSSRLPPAPHSLPVSPGSEGGDDGLRGCLSERSEGRRP